MRRVTTQKGVELLVPAKGEKHPGAGRPKGSKNVMTRVLKDAILLAAEESEHAKNNGDGLVGYLIHIADTRPDIFARLLGRVMMLQEKKRAKPAMYGPAAAAEFEARLIAQGIRFPRANEGTQSSNVIDGPFRRQDPDETDDDDA